MTKTEIIDAAFKVWGRNFYRKTSLSQLACELKVSKPALYRHFESKQALTAAMTERFLDDFANSVREDFDKALQTGDADEGIFIIIKSISGYFARNVYAMVFSLINIYDRNLDGFVILDSLKTRGVDMGTLQVVFEKKYTGSTAVVRLIFATLSFMMSYFHKVEKSMKKSLSEENIKKIISSICKTVKCGLGYQTEKAAIDFDKLEKSVMEAIPASEAEPFFKAVAEAVAEAGPWYVSMDMVAKKLGLSKSSLYGRFKNRKDMLRRLFTTEFKRIIGFARQGINLSNKANGCAQNTAEQLFLGIFSIAVYLRSRPEILITIDWIRTRKLDLGKPDKNLEIFRLFEDVDIEPLQNATEEEKQISSHWILFLLTNILMHPVEGTDSSSDMQNNHIRVLYKFITMGLGGFIE